VDDGAGRGFVEGIVRVVRCAVRAKKEMGEVVTWRRLRFFVLEFDASFDWGKFRCEK
jgi:hypothetical protein